MNAINATIYKIQHSTIVELFYIGSTVRDFESTIRAHISKIDNGDRRLLYKEIIKCGGITKFSFIILESFTCCDNLEVERRKKYWIDSLNPPLNSKKEKLYLHNIKSRISKKRKRNSLYICECGKQITLGEYKRHSRTMIHMQLIEKQIDKYLA